MTNTRYRARILLPTIAASLFGLAACAVDTNRDELGEVSPVGQEPTLDRGSIELVDASAGDVCLYANGAPEVAMTTFETRVKAGDELVAEVMLPACLSGSCDVRRLASCDVTQSGDTLTVTADFQYAAVDDGACTLDCEVLSARCRTGPLEAGTYVVEHAGQSTELTIPSTFDSCPIETERCISDRDCDEGYCGETLAGNTVCREYSQLGDACGGYGRPDSVGTCAPGLRCQPDAGPVDLPGTCVIDARAEIPDLDSVTP